jgi:two-component system CheB/CheR fusion protein
VLIYLNRALQSRVIPKLQYALNDRGYLWLGESEILYTDAQKFKLIDPKHRIFRRIPVSRYPQFDTMIPADRYEKSYHINANGDFEEVIRNLKTGLILLDRDLNVAFCNQAFGLLCCLSSEQVRGKPFFDLAIAHCSIDLKHKIEHVLATGESSVVEDVEYWITNNNRVYLNVEIIPLTSGVIIFLEDITKQHESREELRTMSRALDTAHERLLSTNKELKVANRQLEAINAALQSVNEELESANEELKATNEELNSCVVKSQVLDRCYEMVLNNVGSSVIIMDENLTVKAWNGAPASIWGGVDVEFTGRPLTDLNIGIPLKYLVDQLGNVIETGKSANITLQCTDQQGKKIIVDVLIDMLMDEKPAELVLIIKKSSEQGNHPGTVDV